MLIATLPATAAQTSTQTSSIVGTWELVKADKILPNGQQVEDYGASPHGLVIFTPEGRYSVQIYRGDRKKFASGDRAKGTAEEYKDASLSMSVHFGRYSVDNSKSTITFEIDRSSFPNTDDTTRITPYVLKGEELSWKQKPRPDGAVPVTVLRRAN
jgi:hypothetical protein